MSMETYAKPKNDRLRAAAETAAGQIAQQMEAAACCTGVAQTKTGTDDIAVNKDAADSLQLIDMVSGLGFEPRMREPKSLVLPLHHPEKLNKDEAHTSDRRSVYHKMLQASTYRQ